MEAALLQLKEAPIETPGAIGVVERYHAPLRVAYEKIRTVKTRETTDPECQSMAIFSINSTLGPEGVFPIVLAFG